MRQLVGILIYCSLLVGIISCQCNKENSIVDEDKALKSNSVATPSTNHHTPQSPPPTDFKKVKNIAEARQIISQTPVNYCGELGSSKTIKVGDYNLSIGEDISGKGAGSVYKAKYNGKDIIVKTMPNHTDELAKHMLCNTVNVGPEIIKWFKNDDHTLVVIMEELQAKIGCSTKEILRDSLLCMQRMHNVGQIHGDISPDNLIGTQIIDFDGKYPTSFYSDNKFKDKKSDLVALARSIIYKQYANWIITRCKNKYENINKDLTLVEKVKDFQFHVSHVKSALIDKDFYQLKQYDQRPKKYFGALLDAYQIVFPSKNPCDCFQEDLSKEQKISPSIKLCIDIAQGKIDSVDIALSLLAKI